MIASRHRGSIAVASLMALEFLIGAGAAAAQAVCTMEKLAGTYAFEFHGSSTFVQGAAPPPYRHWSMISAQLIIVGWFTLQADGPMNGEGWVILGTLSSGLTPRPMDGRLSELDESACTGVLEWMGSPVPGGTPGLHRERVVFVDNGREFRSMLMQSPSGSMAWIGRGYRITHAPGPVDTCGPHLLSGDVLLQCETLNTVAGPPASAASMSRLIVAGDGSTWGTSYSKNPIYNEPPVEGAFAVQPNCTVEARLEAPSLPDVVQHGRGVIFKEGKRGFLIMPLETAQPDGSALRPAFARCELLSLGR